MWHYIKEHVRAFWIGFTGSGIVYGNILFLDAAHLNGPVIAYILKLLGAVVIAFLSGLATCAATDFYKDIKPIAITKRERMRKRIKYFFNRIKPKKNERSEKDTEERA